MSTRYPLQKFVYLVWFDFQVKFVCNSYESAVKCSDLYGRNHFGVRDIQKVPLYG